MKKMSTMYAPSFEELLRKAQSAPVIADPGKRDALMRIYEKMCILAVCGEDERHSLWLNVERGPISEFGDYEEYLEAGEVDDRPEFEELWHYYYPDETMWYEFSTLTYGGNFFFFLGDKLTFQITDKPAEAYDVHDPRLIDWLAGEMDKAIAWLRSDEDGYNAYIAQNLPYGKRIGRIVRKDYWKIAPNEKEWMLKGLTEEDIGILRIISRRSEEDTNLYLSSMTAGFFFDCCRLGYEANGYVDSGHGLTAVELYDKFADGRHEGLAGIDPDSPEAFEEWFTKGRTGIGHPWEVCRGGNSTHISLYVGKTEKGWYLPMAGESRGRVAETVRFAAALYREGIPLLLFKAPEILAMITGEDYIGIVPDKVMPVYCHSLFPKEDNIIDFMNLNKETRDAVIAKAYWYPLERVALDAGH